MPDISDLKQTIDEYLAEIPEKGRTCFPQKMKIYAPTKCNLGQGKKIDCTHEVDRLRDNINKIFGGSTAYLGAEGCWFDSSISRVDCEPIQVIEVAHNCTKKSRVRMAMQAILDYAEHTHQYSMSVMNNSFYITETEALQAKAKAENIPRMSA